MNIEKEKKFKLHNLTFVHYYFDSEDKEVGNPIYSSVELQSKYDYETNTLNWKKTIKHSYYTYNFGFSNITNEQTEDFKDLNIIEEIEKIDLRKYKNNYFTDKQPENFSHWEVHYNNYFKIVGTYDQEFKEISKIIELLNIKNIIEKQIEKIKNKNII